MRNFDKDLLESFAGARRESGAGLAFRRKSFASFDAMDMPDFKHGSAIVVKPGMDLSKADASPEGKGPWVRCASKGMEVCEYESYSAMPGGDLELLAGMTLKMKTSMLTDAFCQKMIVIRVPRSLNIECTQAIDLELPAQPSFTNVLIVCEEGSKSGICIKRSSTSAGECLAGLNIRVAALQGSSCEVVGTQALSSGMVFFEERLAQIGKDGCVKWLDLSTGAAFASMGIESVMQGEGAQSSTKFMFTAGGGQRLDLFTSSVHAARHTRSDMQTRGVVAGSAKALSRGLIEIGKEASGSEGYEKQDALILGEGAEADAIPNLEINNHDVKCSHGSTIGQLDSEKMFYLMSRGLDAEGARKLLILGYFSPVLEALSPQHRSDIERLISRV